MNKGILTFLTLVLVLVTVWIYMVSNAIIIQRENTQNYLSKDAH